MEHTALCKDAVWRVATYNKEPLCWVRVAHCQSAFRAGRAYVGANDEDLI